MRYAIRLLGFDSEDYPGGQYGKRPELGPDDDPDEHKMWLWEHPIFVFGVLEQIGEDLFQVKRWSIFPDPDGHYADASDAVAKLEQIVPILDYCNLGTERLVFTWAFAFSDGEWKHDASLGVYAARTFAQVRELIEKHGEK